MPSPKSPSSRRHATSNEGPWAGDTLRQDDRENLRFPANLKHTDMICTSEGYEPVPVRWGGGPISLELKPIGTG